MPPYERGNVSFVGRDLRVPPLPGADGRKVPRRLTGKGRSRAPPLRNIPYPPLPQGHWLHIPLILRGVSLAPGGPGHVFSYILCPNYLPNPIVQNAEIGMKISCKNHKKSAQTPLTTRGFSIIIGKYARKRCCTPGSVYTAMNREIAPQGGNFRGVCPIIGRLRMFCSPA